MHSQKSPYKSQNIYISQWPDSQNYFVKNLDVAQEIKFNNLQPLILLTTQNTRPDLDPNCLTLGSVLERM